ncbi:MAG: YraN family protein [Bacteroidetes bacterium]|nr:YraN family protein [Bacteroidota bacterium]
MAEHNELGERGEELAFKYLSDVGIEVLERNWRKDKLEVDIIAKDEDTIVFVEVKTRGTDYFGKPEHFVDKKKMMMMAEAAEYYIDELGRDDLEVRYDIIAIVIEPDKEIVMHIQDAFFPDNLGLSEIVV